jgi:uncharacterized membrane protein YbaN (DUF454 family)
LSTIPTNPCAVGCPARSGEPDRVLGRVKRYGYAGAGIGCVGLAGVGVAVPGMPTTIFLILASWCFARSCPWLTDKLIHNRVFGPFVRYLEPGAVMPVRAKAISLVMMWAAIGGSSVLVLWRGAPWFVPLFIAAFGVLGTWFIVWQGRAISGADNERATRHLAGRRAATRAKPRGRSHPSRV